MSKSITSKVITTLKHKISKAITLSKENDYIVDSDKNFTRSSKIGLTKTVNILMNLKPTSLKYEMMCYFKDKDISLSPGGFVQARRKIKPELFKDIFNRFNSSYKCERRFKGYRLLAIDGSDINIPYDPKDLNTLHGGRTKNDSSSASSYSQFHLNGMYDCLNSRFVDCIIQGVKDSDEIDAMMKMAEKYDGESSIFIADRGYESMNLFEHLNKLKDHRYLIRVKDITSKASLFKDLNLDFDSNEFDKDVSFTLTNYNKAIYQKDKNYKVIQRMQKFDYLDDDNHFYDVKWRLVRFEVEEGKYELIITNLERDKFNSEDIKFIYKERWRIETAYDYLKNDLNLEHFLSRKREYIKQEIWIKLILYNLSTVICEKLEKRRENKTKRKYEYKINCSFAIMLIFDAFIISIRKGGCPPNLDSMIIRELSPIREGRSFPRVKRSHK